MNFFKRLDHMHEIIIISLKLFNLVDMARKLRHRLKPFMGVQDSILLFGSLNLNNNEDVRIFPAA